MINEQLTPGTLRMLVKDVFEIDSYKSKMGDDSDIVVLSFTVDDYEPARDLVNFIERGYDFVLDADVSPGELADGKYKVFVEIERNKRIAKQITEILYGVEKLTSIDEFKFRYYKSFHSVAATESNLLATVPIDRGAYEQQIKESRLNNFSNFFNRSYVESISMDGDDIQFQKKYAEPLRLRILHAGDRANVYNSVKGPIMMEGRDVSEVLYLTKYIGNYNITKIGNTFVLENEDWAIAVNKL
jgi:multimeric flavodoxin WrbA